MHGSPLSGHTTPGKIVKSGVLYKKVQCILHHAYKERFFELTKHGELTCYEMQSNGQKTKTEEIQLSPTTRIEKRSGRPHARRNAKFIIHLDDGTQWYLWCRKEEVAEEEVIAPPLSKHSPKSRTNPVASSVYYNNVLFPYHQYHRRHPSSTIRVLDSAVADNEAPSSYTSLTSISSGIRRSSKSCGSLFSPLSSMISPIKLSVDILYEMDIDIEIDPGEKAAQKWCYALQRCIAHLPRRINSLQKLSLSMMSNTSSECDVDEVIAMPWTLKSCYMMLKVYRYGYRYKRMYFVLRMNGILDYYVDETQREHEGCIDILNGCRSVEKRQAKFIVFTQLEGTNGSGDAYYFWCKDNQNLCSDWYYLIDKIIADKMKNIDQYLKIAESTLPADALSECELEMTYD
eukprot:8297_1